MRNGNLALINGGLSTKAIVRTRFPLARLPDGTSGQVLTAQGAGVDPAYAAAVGSIIAPSTFTPANINDPVDLNMDTSVQYSTIETVDTEVWKQDLGAIFAIIRIAYKFGTWVSGGVGSRSKLQYSTDDSTWTDIINIASDYAAENIFQDAVEYASVDMRYLRVVLQATADNTKYVKIYHFVAFGR
jgi:hypothetical protein